MPDDARPAPPSSSDGEDPTSLSAPAAYTYPQTNSSLIKTLNLEPHPEGGHFAVTWVASESVPSPFAAGQAQRSVASCIYYLLSVSSPEKEVRAEEDKTHTQHRTSRAFFHLNRSPTMHLHHSGRSTYTLIRALPPLGIAKPGERPEVRMVTMGEDDAKGERRQLLVEGGWWKVSEVPYPDREAVKRRERDPERTGALISEVVTPGFDWEDHTWMTAKDLHDLFPDDEETRARFAPYVKDREK